MRIIKLKNANASVVAVTVTATLLPALLTTAAGENQELPVALDAVLLNPEDGDVRMIATGNAPTASKGLLLKQGGFYKFCGINVTQIQLIRTGSSNVNVGVQVGFTEAGESSFASGTGLSLATYDDGSSNLKTREQFAPGYEDNTNNVAKVEMRYLPFAISTATTTTVASGAGYVDEIFVAGGTLGNVTIYDNTAASGTVLLPTVTPVAGGVLLKHVVFSLGLTIVTAAATVIGGGYRLNPA